MSRIGILTTDTDLVVRTWDTALERMTGISADRAIGQRLDTLVPDLGSRVPLDLIREPLVSGSAQVLATALHKYLIPCPTESPSEEFDLMQQRVVIGALRDDHHAVGLVISIEDVTERLERERRLARQLREGIPSARLEAVEQLAPLHSAGEGIGPLAGAIGDDDWRVRRAAVKALAARRDAELVDAVVTALREGHRDFSLLSSALQLLTLTGVDFTDALVRLMQDPDADLRIQASLALGTQRRPEAVDALLRALDDPDPNVRFHAIEALGKLAPASAIEPLAKIAESGDFYFAFPAIEALVRINDPMIAGRLAPLVRDPVLGAAAAEALGRIGDEDVVAHLVNALPNTTIPVHAILEALTQIHRRYETAFVGGEQIEELVRRTMPPSGVARILDALARTKGDATRPFVVVLGWLQDPAIPPALARLLGSAEARHDVIEAFVRCGSSTVALLIEHLGSSDPDITRSVVVALGRIGDRRAVPPLIALLDEAGPDLRVPIVSALARIGDPRAFVPLLALLGEPDIGTRQAAIGALNSIGHPDMARHVRELLADPQPLIRESAVKIAGYFGYRECTDRFLACCADSDERVRAAALEHLPYFEDARALAILSKAMDHDTPPARAAAAKALAAVPESHAHILLERAIDDPEPWVRYFAAISLGRQGVATTVNHLARLATDDPAPHVRVAAVEALGSIGGPAAIEILKPLAEQEDDGGVAAIAVLGRADSPDVLPTLTEAVRSSHRGRRLAGIKALAGFGNEEAVEALKWAAAGDADPDVVRAALASLARIASDSSVGRSAVRALLANLTDAQRRDDTLAALSQLAASAIPFLSESLADDDPRLRRGVVEVLGRLSHPAASVSLQKALYDTDAVVRREAVRALARFGTIGLQRRFSALAETDPAPAVRQAAAAALSRQLDFQEGGE